MEFTKEEKEVLRDLVEKHLVELKDNESMIDQTIEVLGTEMEYDEFLTKLLKKLR